MSKTFPKDCTEECPYYRCWDLSIDDYTNVCDKLHIQVDDCDAYGPFYIPRFCPLETNSLAVIADNSEKGAKGSENEVQKA